MKTMTKRLISIVLTIMMLMTSIPFSSIAIETDDSLCISVAQEIGFLGETVDVEISVKNNPGLGSLKIDVGYGEYLTLENVSFSSEFGSLVTAPIPYTNPQTLSCMSPLSEITTDGVFATLTFSVAENAPNNYISEIKVTYNPNDICDGDLVNVAAEVENGKVTICHRKPGDVNHDDLVDNKDAIIVFRHSAGWDVKLGEEDKEWMDVNADFYRDNKDAILIFRASAGWESVKLLPPPVKHEHTLDAVSKKEATCTVDGNIAYWSCTACGKYFKDEEAKNEIALEKTVIKANGHTEVIIPAVKPTDTSVGYTEGKKCSVCDEIIVAPSVIPIPNSYAINYDIFNGDHYLSKLKIDNPNPKSYKDDDVSTLEIDLIDLDAPDGYRFLGWYDGAGDGAGNGANKVRAIPQGSIGNKKFYAHWHKIEYTVQFDSPDNPVESITYTVDKGRQINNPDKVNQYEFIGWSDDDGFFVTSIEPGTTGDITLHANWTSYRNKMTAYASYGDPIVIENAKDKQFLFVYKIGEISNVPVSTIVDYGWRTKGSSVTEKLEKCEEVTEESASQISDMISKATTTSSGWTLSKDWDTYYSAETEEIYGEIKSEERTNSKGQTVGGEYFVSNSDSGSTYISTECGGSTATSAKVTTEKSAGINGSVGLNSKAYCSAEISAENKTEVSAGVKVPIPVGTVEAGVKNTTTVGASVKNGREDSMTVHFDGHKENYVGTYNSTDTNSYYNSAMNQSSAWNTTSGYTQSKLQSVDSSVSNAIATEIKNRDKINISNAASEGKSLQATDSFSSTDTETYTSTLRSSKGTKLISDYTDSQTFAADGYYRLVQSARIYVYGVVGYDVATSSFYTYTYSVMDDELKPWLDYSMNNQYFEDCQNGVLPFKIPIYPLEYVSLLTNKSSGLEFDLADKLSGYDNTSTDLDHGVVIVPQYYGAKNGKDGTYTAVTVNSFDGNANVFKGDETIKTVILPKSVTEIPDNAFEGCTNLETVIAYGITSIGNNAFNGCISLNTFTVDKFVEHIGTNAFGGVNEIVVEAKNMDVFDAALDSGAKRITISMHSLTEPLVNKTITIPSDKEYFALLDNGKQHSGLVVNSSANETYISNMKFVDNKTIPLVIDSEKLTLNRVSVVDTPKLALQLKKENTALYLYGTVSVSSQTDNAVLCRNITVKKENAEVNGMLSVEGKVIVCGADNFDGKNRIEASKGIEFVDSSRYDNILNSHVVEYDSLGGTAVNNQLIENGTKATEPNAPAKTNCTFLGWYTDKACTTKFDFGTPVTNDITLYAKWKLNEFTVTFDACGGSASQTSKKVIYNEKYGVLPTAARTGYSFNGWYTSASGGTKITENSTVTETANHTLYAQWSLNSYAATWSVPTGVSISVSRTSSPLAGASTGTISSGSTIYHGDVLSISYSEKSGYTLTSKGKTGITVSGNVTSSDIYAAASVRSYTANWSVPSYGSINVTRISSPLAGAHTGTVSSGSTIYHGDVLSISYSASTGYSVQSRGRTDITVSGNVTGNDIYLSVSPNSYAYSIVYKSSNGTSLGSGSVTGTFNTTKTVSPQSFSGYDTPSSQNIKWDSTSKTITFVYTPTSVDFTKVSGQHYTDPITVHSAVAEYRNRTATTVEMRITWTDQITHPGGGWNYNSQRITATIGGVKSAEVIVVPWGTWSESTRTNQPAKTASTAWVTVSVNAGTTSVPVSVYHRQTNYPGDNMGSSFTKTFDAAIPKY